MADSRNNDVAVLVHDVARYMRTYAHQLAQEHGITRAQLLILARLEQQPEISQNELACAAEVTPTTIARLVDRLEQLGFVKRCADPEDRRIWRLQLTPAAMPLLREVDRFRAKLRGVMTRGLDSQTVDLITAGLRTMKANLARRLSAAAE
jgi:DNA-binding MarR family transcriptional regulator